MSAAWVDAAVWHADGTGTDDLDDVTGPCTTCDAISTFRPDENDEAGLLVCIYCGCLMDGAADYT